MKSVIHFLSAGVLIAARLSLNTQRAAADCIYCQCNDKLYDSADLQTCQNECHTTLGCFTGICAPAHLPGEAPHMLEKFRQDHMNAHLSCYSGLLHSDDPSSPNYNCVASAIGVKDRLIDLEVDGYGNRDGKLQVSDFDAFFSMVGYTTSADCTINQSGGVEKIALFGKQVDNPPQITDEFHVARQATDPGVDQTTGPWFESKEGGSKQIIHHLRELDGADDIGPLIKCYQRAVP